MTVDLRLGKLRGLRRMATPAGHFHMIAVDQRHQIATLIAARRGIAEDQVSFADMVRVKRMLVRELGRHASAVLLDPDFSFPGALQELPGRTGLLVTLEDNRFEENPGGRRSRSIRNWSVEKIKRAGGDGVKLLAWFRPDADPEVVAHQKSFVENIGQECRRHDIALVLELLVYPLLAGCRSNRAAGDDTADRLLELVLGSVREFVQPRYGVDLLKLESPQAGATLPVRDGGAGQQRAQRGFDEMGALCREAGIPWVMLSAGVPLAQFVLVMEYAYAAGANGFLAGRAIWWDALQRFPDLEDFAAQLRGQAAAGMDELEALTLRAGNPWQPDYSCLDSLKSAGDLCAAYP